LEGKMRDNTSLKVTSLLIFSLLLFLFPASIFAQSTGSIGGKVTDVNGNPLSGVVVKLEGYNIGAITDDNGEYVILNVDVGTYTLEASLLTYETKKVTNVKVSVDQRTKVDIQLKSTEFKTEVIVIEAERKGIDVE